jgi:hypothetical protein
VACKKVKPTYQDMALTDTVPHATHAKLPAITRVDFAIKRWGVHDSQGYSSLVHSQGYSSLVHSQGCSSLVHSQGCSSFVHSRGYNSKFCTFTRKQQQFLYIHENTTASLVHSQGYNSKSCTFTRIQQQVLYIHDTAACHVHSRGANSKPCTLTTMRRSSTLSTTLANYGALTMNGVTQPHTAVRHAGNKPFAVSRRISGVEMSEPRGHLLQDDTGAVRPSADKKVPLSAKRASSGWGSQIIIPLFGTTFL